MLERLISWDYIAWYQVNVVWTNPVMDYIAPFLRNQWFWAPLYLFLLVFMPKNFKRKGWMWCLAFLLTFAVGDFTSASVIKPYFLRLRPCNDPRIMDIVHLLVPCGSGKSFPSTHATNHFALAMFAIFSLKKKYKQIWLIALPWAIIVSYCQIYVGVHFPLDVIVGAILGSTIGYFTGRLFDARYKMYLS
jgi:undecaprenyl-diphosphatase